MNDFLTIDIDEFLRRWRKLIKSREPKKVFIKDGALIAGENISRGDLVYLHSSFQKVNQDE